MPDYLFNDYHNIICNIQYDWLISAISCSWGIAVLFFISIPMLT